MTWPHSSAMADEPQVTQCRPDVQNTPDRNSQTPCNRPPKSGEYITQVTAFGPISLEYLDPADDPRRQAG